MAKQIKYSYYRGQFRSQFSLGNYTDHSNGRRKLYEVILEPKFQLFNAKAISVDEFEKQIRCNTVVSKCKSYLHSIKDFHVVRVFARDFIEVYPGAETKGGRYLYFDSFAAFYTYDGLRTNSGNGGFYAKEGKSGKFTGEGFIQVIEDEELIKEAIVQKVKADTLIYKVVAATKGCFSRKTNSIGGSVTAPDQSGCFNKQLPFGGLSRLGGPSTLGGCFNAAQQPGGCFSMGWLGRILGLLGLLALLLYLLSMLRNCERTSGEQVVYIHDTVVVEVVKERVDTIEVVRIDTTKFLKTNNTKTTDLIQLPNVQFETDKDILVPGSLPDIQRLAEFLIKNKHVKADIYGHTDNVGDRNHNLDLSQRRADAVRDFLVKLGVESSRIKTRGFGPDQPKNKNDTPEGRLMNRRVEVMLTNMLSKTEETVEVQEL